MAEGDPPAGGGRGSDDVHIRTFLIADVRGYTLFTQERGDEGAGKLAAKFARIAREVVAGRGGTLLELRGDERPRRSSTRSPVGSRRSAP